MVSVDLVTVRNFLLVSIAALAAAGCKEDVGECNLDPALGPAALELASKITDGTPMYEGQAIVKSSCAFQTFCHTGAAVGAERFGAPFGINFDVDLACTDGEAGCEPPVPCNDDPTSDYCSRLTTLNGNRSVALDFGRSIVTQVQQGDMPPGGVGMNAVDTTEWLDQDGFVLPTIYTSEGREIVRNWVACGAPVVARTEIPPSPGQQLQDCASIDEEICIYRGAVSIPDPTWSSIYEMVIFPQCVVCHGPANPDPEIPGGASPTALAALDLTGSDTVDTAGWAAEAHGAVVGVAAAASSVCAGQGVLIVPSDPAASILVQKLKNEQTCGTRMPQTGPPVLGASIEVIEQWVNEGALNN